MSSKTSCPHDPQQTTGAIGQYHCPECGAMVLAGYSHPSDDDVIDQGLEPYKSEEDQSSWTDVASTTPPLW